MILKATALPPGAGGCMDVRFIDQRKLPKEEQVMKESY
jgi:hypothetical protein